MAGRLAAKCQVPPESKTLCRSEVRRGPVQQVVETCCVGFWQGMSWPSVAKLAIVALEAVDVPRLRFASTAIAVTVMGPFVALVVSRRST
jgi:hypothetical protein